MSDEAQRQAIREVMERRGLNPHALSQKAKIRPSTLYNFLSGVFKTLSVGSIRRIAEATDSSVDELLGGAPVGAGHIEAAWEVGHLGRLFILDTPVQLKRPPGVAPEEDAVAAIAAADLLYPMPGAWTVVFRRHADDPEGLIGKLCVVRAEGAAQPMIRTLHRGTVRGLYRLTWWAGPDLEDVAVAAAHLVLVLAQS